MPKAIKQRRNHPIASYLVGFVFVILTAIVFVGIVLHLTISSHGPQLLKPLLGMYLAKNKSEIMEEAKRLEDLEIHQHFHHLTEFPRLPENMRPVCYICHSDLVSFVVFAMMSGFEPLAETPPAFRAESGLRKSHHKAALFAWRRMIRRLKMAFTGIYLVNRSSETFQLCNL